MISELIGLLLDRFADRASGPPTNESRAYEAYKAAWKFRGDSLDVDRTLSEQFARYSVPPELADPDTVTGALLREWFSAGRRPRRVKHYLL